MRKYMLIRCIRLNYEIIININQFNELKLHFFPHFFSSAYFDIDEENSRLIVGAT